MYKNIEEMAEYLDYEILSHNKTKMVIAVKDHNLGLYGIQTYTKSVNCIYPDKFISMGNNKDLVIRYVGGKKDASR